LHPLRSVIDSNVTGLSPNKTPRIRQDSAASPQASRPRDFSLSNPDDAAAASNHPSRDLVDRDASREVLELDRVALRLRVTGVVRK